MKKIVIGTLALFCVAAFIPAAFAGDDAELPAVVHADAEGRPGR